MQTRQIILAISLALNLVLVTGIFVSAKGKLAQQKNSRATPVQPVGQNQASGSKVDARETAFDWRLLVSGNLQIYRDNLSAFGCPDFIIRSVILGQVNERFEPQRESVLAAMQNTFWEFAIRGESAVRGEWITPMAALSAERQAVINDVLGTNYGIAKADLQSRRDGMARDYSWLPPQKRDQLFALEEKHRQSLEEWVKSVGSRMDGHFTAGDSATLQQIQNKYDGAKQALLTTAELAECDLRGSKNSLWASSLSGFQATEDEWRNITQLHNDYEAAQNTVADPNSSDDQRQQAQQTLMKPLEQAIQESLGVDRYAQYELANNGQFQGIFNVTQRYHLPQNVAVQAFQIQQDADRASQQLLENTDLAPDARQTALAAIQQETERSLSEALGQKAFSTYKEYRSDQ